MRRRSKRGFGSARSEHKRQEEFSLSSAETRLVGVREYLDSVEAGDVYSCDAALHSLLDASYMTGQVRSDVRAQRRSEPDKRYSKVRDVLDAATDRFHKVCIIPSQKRHGQR
jgi:hypothetical protein